MERITREIYLYFDGERRVNRARFDPALRTSEGIVVEKLDRVDAFFVRVHQRRKLVCMSALRSLIILSHFNVLFPLSSIMEDGEIGGERV